MLHGREAERSTIAGLLDAARDGVSGALVIRGEPGIGKTALLEFASSRAEGMRIMRGAGIESESELPFAGLHLLLRGVLDRLDAIPAPQRRALAGAFGLESGSGDRFMIGAAVLSLLAEAAEQVPVLCLVDDAHWLDRPSSEALLFAARRLGREGVVILFAARDHVGTPMSGGISEIHLRGLDADSAAALVDDGGAVLAPSVRDQLLAETNGNPLALRELAPTVAADGYQVGPIPLTRRVLDAFHSQVRALPVASQTLLLFAAADDTGELPFVLRAAGTAGLGLADLQPAETSELVVVSNGRLTFRHPLIRAAVYHGAPASQRITAHSALAAACGDQADADRRSWHLALAATGPDEHVAAELEQAADRASARNGHATAASTYERAARMSPDPTAALRRLVLACDAAVESGQLEWAKERAQQILRETADPAVRARLIDVVARADFVSGALHQAHDLLLTGADIIAGDDPDRAFWMLVDALHAAWGAPTDQRLIARPVDRLTALPLAAPLRSVSWLARWATAAALDRDTSTFPPLARVAMDAQAAAAAAGPRAMADVAIFAYLAGQDHVSAEVAAALVAHARDQGAIVALPLALAQLAHIRTMLGHHREALASGTEALQIAQATGQPYWERYAYAALSNLAAIEGDERRCRELAAGADLGPDAAPGASAGSIWGQTALALLDLGYGRVHEAFDRLRAVLGGPTRHHAAVVRSIPDLVDSAVRLGRPQEVAEAITQYSRWAGTLSQPWIDALLARCHAMTSSGPEAEKHYLRALALHEPRSRPFERARTELYYGEWLRRARRTSEARVHLSTALQVFDELGSTPWADRARLELGATGAAVPRATVSDGFAELTPQELQITQLAARGLSNRDIAAQLFLSPRTVAYHLYKAYPKLGINSRGELAGLSTSSAG